MLLVMLYVNLSASNRYLSITLERSATVVFSQVRRIHRERIHGLRAWLASGAYLSPANERLCLIVYFQCGVMDSVCHSICEIQLSVQLSIFQIRISRLLSFAREARRILTTRRLAQADARFATSGIFMRAIVAVSLSLISANLPTFGGSRFRIGKIVVCICFRQVRYVRRVAVVVVRIASDVFIN